MNRGKYISSTTEYNTFEKNIPAPYMRKSFISDVNTVAKLKIAVCGFYELYFNGKKYTKGLLAPYICNPNHYVYYDEYEIPVELGENVLGLILGNGFQNNPGGYIWDFDKADFRSAPKAMIELSYISDDGTEIIVKSDESFKTKESPIRFDDYRFGEVYDANYEINNWNSKGFDDSSWENAVIADTPKGELKLCKASPIVIHEKLYAKRIIKSQHGYIYDFGISNAGVCQLRIKGQKGQRLEIRYADAIENNELLIEKVWFKRDNWKRDKNIVHRDVYICKGNTEEIYKPSFTYHGFRYAEIRGVDDKDIKEDLLTYIVLHSDIKTGGGFKCSDETVNLLQEMTRRSDISNFHYFPTDCPHREKNGWTGDAALSCEQMLLNFKPEKDYKEWLYNICKAQNSNGVIPGIIPTSGWGYEWGNGPAWDCALVYLPYFTYLYRGETDMIYIAAESMAKYLKYLISKQDEKGLIHFGLGDWCQPGRHPAHPEAPLSVTDTVISMDICNKAAYLFQTVGMTSEKCFAEKAAQEFKNSIRAHLIDFNSMTVSGNCQTSQSMCLFYDVFEDDEKPQAFNQLLRFINESNEHINVGVLGGRVIFHVLSEFGYSNLALKMITRSDYPSYGNWIKRGATTLWEAFNPPYRVSETANSMNHHFWGDISAWFIKHLAGINVNPHKDNCNYIEIKPTFPDKLSFAQGHYISNCGTLYSKWERHGNNINLSINIPDKITGKLILPDGYLCESIDFNSTLKTGEYLIENIIKP